MDWTQAVNRSLLELSDAHSASRMKTDEYRRRRRELLDAAALAARRHVERESRLQRPARSTRVAREAGRAQRGYGAKATVLAVVICVALAAGAGAAMFEWLR